MTSETKSRIHPLMAGAAAAVIVFSLVGVAAMTGYLPGTSAQKADPAAAPATPVSQAAPAKPAPAKPAQAVPPKHTQVASAPAAAAAKPRCADCGTVVEVKMVEVKGEGSGLGAVAGGVAGGVLGHEIVDGKNQGIATVAGAAAGAFAGHQIEKQVKTTKRWDVAVKMEDGSARTIAYAEAPAWKAGDKVRVAGATLQPLK